MVDATSDEACFTEHHRAYPLAAPVMRQASPLPPLTGEELVPIEGSFSFEDDVDGAGELLGEDGQRLGLAVLVHESLMELLAIGVASQEQAGGLAEGLSRRWTLPIFLPEVPVRLPADSLTHLTSRA